MLKRIDTSSRFLIIRKTISYDKLWIHSFVYLQGSPNFLLEERIITPFHQQDRTVHQNTQDIDRFEI